MDSKTLIEVEELKNINEIFKGVSRQKESFKKQILV